MILADRPSTTTMASATVPAREKILVLSNSDYDKLILGETVRHPTACKDVSGTWEVKFKRNSPDRHKKLYG